MEPMTTAAVVALARRLSTKRKATTVTITRISGDPEAPEHDETIETVVLQAPPEPDMRARRLARLALVLSVVAVALAGGVALRLLWEGGTPWDD